MPRLAVCTLATPNFDAIFNETAVAMEAYAHRCGADFLVCPTQADPPHFGKYEIITSLADTTYDQVLYLDADIYCRQAAPSIFERFKKSAARSELPHPRLSTIHKSIAWIRRNCDADYPLDQYYNTGVLLFNQRALVRLADLINTTPPKVGRFFEQDQLNWMMCEKGLPSEDLPLAWNAPVGPNWAVLVGDYNKVHFIHGNAVEPAKKLKMLQRFIHDYP